MSENLDLVRSIYTAWERGDFSSAAWADPEIEFVFAAGPEAGRSRGIPAMRETWGAAVVAWEKIRVVVDAYRELDPERVLLLCHSAGQGRSSGLQLGEIEQSEAILFTIRGAKVVRLALYWDRDRALADLGLTE